MVIDSAHKFGGPVGIGALLVHDLALLEPVGGHERGYRRGTENLPGALGMAAALEAGGEPYLGWDSHDLMEGFAAEVRAIGGTWFADRLDAPTGYIHSVAMPRLSGKAQLMRFDLAGISVSQGSACSSGSLHSSHVLKAMGVPDEEAERAIRFSLGWNTTREEVERFCETWLAMAREGAERAA
jgi:cysteine desulfurase